MKFYLVHVELFGRVPSFPLTNQDKTFLSFFYFILFTHFLLSLLFFLKKRKCLTSTPIFILISCIFFSILKKYFYFVSLNISLIVSI